MADDGRKLGLSELMLEHLSERFNTMIYFHAAVLRSNYFFTEEEFIQSLKILINFQPFLRTKVVKGPNLLDGRDTYFFRPCEVDVSSLLRVRKKAQDEDWVAVINEEEIFLSRDERFGDGPQWRVVLSMPERLIEGSELNEPSYAYDVVFIMKHTFVDGVSCYDMVYRQLLPILNSIANKECPNDRFVHPLQLTPSYEEDFLDVQDSADVKSPWYLTLLMKMMRVKNKMFKDRLYEPLYKSQGSPFSEDGTGPCISVITGKLLDGILKKRKEKNIGVHSILITALSFATLKLFQKHEIPLPAVIKGGWPIDSRKFDAKYESPQPLGMLTGSSGLSEMEIPCPFHASKELFWEKAKSIDEGVKRDNQRQSDVNLQLFAYHAEDLSKVESCCHYFNEFYSKPHFVLSNLGKCSPGGELTETSSHFIDAEKIYFGLCGRGFGATNVPFFVTAVNHKNKIFLANCYSRKWISREFVCEFMDFFQDMLIMACQENAN